MQCFHKDSPDRWQDRFVRAAWVGLTLAALTTPHAVASPEAPSRDEAAGSARPILFERDIRPIFRTYCYDCHGAMAELKGNLDLRLVRSIERGGDAGPAIVKGDPAASYLLQRVKSGEMPPGDHRVAEEHIATLESWIASGAPTARPEPSAIGPGLGVTPEERRYWAFRPIARPALPEVATADRVRTPIDAFLAAQLESHQLSFAPDADRRTLIRRAYLDLLGLPPTPDEVEAFINDPNPNAWESLIDELLKSPRYGERWGRHWLDVAGYADSEGHTEQDAVRPWAYKYRDWVVRALNDDMPFDQFIVWQLAGDELVAPPYKDLAAADIDRLTATGFLRMAADGTGSENTDEARNQVVADTIKIVSSSLLGLSVGCAQCHDHRYDPISQEDYFRLRAVLEPALDYRHWKTPAQRQISLLTDEERAAANAIEAEAQQVAEQRSQKQQEFMELALQGELAKLEESLRAPVEEAYRTAADQRSEAQKELLARHPNIESLSPGVLYQYNQPHADALAEFDKQIGEIRARKPPEEFLRVLTEEASDDQGPTTQLFYRGDFRQPQQAVAPGGLTVATPAESPLQILPNDPRLPSTGRRLAYARWLTSGRHPLVARVLANRFWLHHFGQTLVRTPDEFGKLGAAPTHPELLDWLADEFMTHGWSLKHLHRQIMTSTVYRQQSTRHDEGNLRDAGNRWYWHFPLRRLEAEAMRDGWLAVSGRLDSAPFGPAAAVAPDETGQIVAAGEKQRRSIYLQVRRTQPLAMLASFDAPVMEVNCAVRSASTGATQSLMLMNSAFALDCASAFARRVASEADVVVPHASAADRLASTAEEQQQLRQIVAAWRFAYGRDPDDEEAAAAGEFLAQQQAMLLTRGSDNPLQQALTDLCQSLLSSNEFLYIQ